MTNPKELNVSRETFERLAAFVALVEKWNPTINLISKQSVAHMWERHIADSIQLFELAPKTQKWVDLGSGGGFPGIVIAILSAEYNSQCETTLVESDQRKSVFLKTAIRELDLAAEVLPIRIESVPSLHANVVSARALSDLSTLLGFAKAHSKADGVALFPKGKNWRDEHRTAQRMWSYTCEPIKSVTDPSAAILKIKDITRV